MFWRVIIGCSTAWATSERCVIKYEVSFVFACVLVSAYRDYSHRF
jgi:hypothetical protein